MIFIYFAITILSLPLRGKIQEECQKRGLNPDYILTKASVIENRDKKSKKKLEGK
ncbi:MAG: hypothetical protein QW423_02405 [Candidatus Aenigmatarchaeota archaeon]